MVRLLASDPRDHCRSDAGTDWAATLDLSGPIRNFVTVGQFFFRPEDDQWQLIRACGADAFDAAVVQARYLAPFPEAHQRHGKDPRELAHALAEHGGPWLIDLCTPALCERDVVRAEGWARLREARYAKLFELPLDPSVLDDSEARNAFVDATREFQLSAPIPSVPYLEFDRDDDPRLDANLAMLRRVVGAASGRLAAGFVQVSLENLNRGLLLHVARRYAETGVKLLFLRVRNLAAESATGRQLGRYVDAVAAFKTHEIEVVADQSGHFGLAAVAGGAAGLSAGAQFFRNVPAKQVYLGGGGGGRKLPVEVPGQFATLPRDEVGADFSCPVEGCLVTAGDRSTNAFREHNLHCMTYLARLDSVELRRALRESGQQAAGGWATELEERESRSA